MKWKYRWTHIGRSVRSASATVLFAAGASERFAFVTSARKRRYRRLDAFVTG
jgi:hypothetical protein